MADETDKITGQARGARDDRLKSALRENLKRRKLQARERATISDLSQNEDASPSEGTAGKAGG